MDRRFTLTLEFARVGQGTLKFKDIPGETVLEEVNVSLAEAIRESAVRIECGPLPTIEDDRT